jgi:hydroxymethylpyrimidine pyrophosphatase-like HAD family hydrolase
MADFRLVATDLDGTLLDAAGMLSERTRLVVRALYDSGIVLALATSRRFTGAASVAAELDLAGPLIVYDGAQVRDFPSGSIMMEDALDPDVAQAVCERLDREGLRPIVQYGSVDGEFLRIGPALGERMLDATYLAHFASQISEAPIHALCRGPLHPLRIVTFGSRRRLRAAALALAALPCATQVLPNGNYNSAELTIFSSTASKGHALERLGERLGIPREQTFAIGDGVNDVSLLRSAGLAVAMANGCAEARAAANVVARSHVEDGAAEAIERHVLRGAAVPAIPNTGDSGLQ